MTSQKLRHLIKYKRNQSKKIPGEEMQMLQHTRNSHAGTVGEVMHPDNAQCMEKCAPLAARWDTLGRYAGAEEATQCMKWK